MNFKLAKNCVLGTVIVILVLTVLEFPAPIGFETRPQNNVSLFWLALFLAILVSEIATIIFIRKRPMLGTKLAIIAAVLNILQVIADQAHLMQPEAASFGYSLLEAAVVVASLALAYCAWNVYQSTKRNAGAALQ